MYSYGPEQSIRARATQLDGGGVNFLISLYLPAFTGDALVELVGATGVANQYFNYNVVYGQTWGSNDNYIESVNDLMYSSSNPPSLDNIVGDRKSVV